MIYLFLIAITAVIALVYLAVNWFELRKKYTELSAFLQNEHTIYEETLKKRENWGQANSSTFPSPRSNHGNLVPIGAAARGAPIRIALFSRKAAKIAQGIRNRSFACLASWRETLFRKEMERKVHPLDYLRSTTFYPSCGKITLVCNQQPSYTLPHEG
jgi:hypothetical protein